MLKITPFRAEGVIGKIEMVVHIPIKFPNIMMYQKENLGTNMSDLTITKHHFSKYPNYKPFGWEASDLPSNKPFRVDLIADDI